MHRIDHRKFIFAFSMCLFLAFASVAQTGNSSLRGTVVDPNGASVPQAVVTISNTALNINLSTKSDKDGAYQFLEVRPATYVLTVTATGFANYKQTGLILLVATPTTNDVKMQLASVATTVEVITTTQTINTTDATIGNAFNQTQISALPFEGRDPAGILALQPGVTTVADRGQVDLTGDSRGGSVNGSRSDQTNLTLDGIDNNDQTLGTAFVGALRATLDSIEEFRVTTSNAGVDQGRSSGAQVQLVTKSGTNNWHGTAYEYNRPKNLVANDYFNKHAQEQTCAANGTPSSDPSCNTAPNLLRNTFGGSFGGPIKKDRLFFFLAYEGQRTRENSQSEHTVPSASLRDGVIQYLCQTHTDGSLDTTACPGGSVQGLSGANYSFIPGYNALSPTQIAQMDPHCSSTGTCPWGPGVDPNVISTLNQYPQPNSNQTGDGLNYAGYTFSSPAPNKLDTYVAKFDYNLTQNGTQRVFARLGLQNDHANQAQWYPGQPAREVDTNNSKGIIAGYSWTLSPTKINSFHYGYVRQGVGQNGGSTDSFVNLRGLEPPTANTRTTSVIVPVHNVTDDFSWSKGKHTFQFGGNWRRVTDFRQSNANSFTSALTNTGFLVPTGISNVGGSFDPAAFGFPAVDGGFANSYDYPMMALSGVITETDTVFVQNKAGQYQPNGAFVTRHFRDNELEFYAQDSWR
ncbi:MAG: carboxypeptidase regulatory-like domain-containing protein, partial [Acidobacteria bacterium]|nr:carboxypeptidase regulatory-like domain-containing protein [Acidobacteriota bacterium]